MFWVNVRSNCLANKKIGFFLNKKYFYIFWSILSKYLFNFLFIDTAQLQEQQRLKSTTNIVTPTQSSTTGQNYPSCDDGSEGFSLIDVPVVLGLNFLSKGSAKGVTSSGRKSLVSLPLDLGINLLSNGGANAVNDDTIDGSSSASMVQFL